MESSVAIEVKELTKEYFFNAKTSDLSNSFKALDNISFSIKKGESIAIIGANGSGKSTLLKVLAGVVKPTSGTVKLNGRVATILDIGAGFHPELSGKENIYVNGQLLGFSKKEIRPQVEEIIAFSGIQKFINEPIKNYSNGMFLRLAYNTSIIQTTNG